MPFFVVVFLTENRTCNSGSKTDAAAAENKVASKPAASCICDLAAPTHNKFVWPGIDAIVEAYATHVEGADSC